MVTLWMVTVLTVLAMAIGRYLSYEVRLTKLRMGREQAEALARSGVYLAMQRLARDGEEADGQAYDWLGDDWADIRQEGSDGGSTVWVLPFPGGAGGSSNRTGQLRVRITDEERKLNINTASVEALTKLLEQAGALEAPALAQAIEDYRDPSAAGGERPEVEPPYVAKHQPVVALEELRDLPGMDAATYDGLQPFVSASTSAGQKLNINTVSSTVLLALGLRDSTVQSIVAYRDGPDGPERHEQDGVFRTPAEILQIVGGRVTLDDTEQSILANAFGTTSATFTVSSEAAMNQPAVVARVVAVVQRAPEGVRVLSWRQP